jgi:hypothetical protein
MQLPLTNLECATLLGLSAFEIVAAVLKRDSFSAWTLLD